MKIVPTGAMRIDFHRSETDPLHHATDVAASDHPHHDDDDEGRDLADAPSPSRKNNAKQKQKTASTLATVMSSTSDGGDDALRPAGRRLCRGVPRTRCLCPQQS